MRVDLHCHSTFSDGSHGAAEVAEMAARQGVELFCLTDHDSCAGFPATREVLGERALRGVELSVHEQGRTIHLLVYDVLGDDDAWRPIDEALASQAAARVRRLRAMAARLDELGVPVNVDVILDGARDRTVGRPDLARALVKAGHVRSTSQAFSRYLRDGGPADVPVRRLSVDDGLELAREAGARAALAHPDTAGEHLLPILRRCRDRGLEGIEAIYGAYGSSERRRWLRVARDFDLVVTAGSDFHGEMMPRIPRPVIELPDEHAERLRAWLTLP